MNYTVITTKIDLQTKQQAQKKAEELGVPLSVLIKAFLKHFIHSQAPLIRTERVEFSTRDEEPSEYLKKIMRQAEKNWKEGKHSPVFETGKEAVRWLEKQGI